MRRALPLCAALCALLHFGTGASLKAVSGFEKELDRLQPEIDLWIKLQNPAELNFPHAANASKTGLVIERPKKASLLFPNYEKDVVLYLFTRENRQATKVAGNAAAFKEAGWKASRPTYVAIHGFTNNIESPMFKSLVPAVLDHTDANVVAVDWGVLCPAPLYLTARGHVPKVGEYLGGVLEHLITDGGMDPATTHIIGHSLGAHVAGIAGRTVKSGTIGRVTALDPAMPLFLVLKADRVGKGDAALVDVVHTCAGELGLVDTIGDVDFYPNGGSRQDGCGLDLTGSCSHGRSVEYFVESANEPDAFEAAECASSHSAVEGQCSATYDGRMGFNIKYNPNGSRIYYLQTASSAPFDIETHTRLHDSHE